MFEELATAAYLVDRLADAFSAIDRSIALRRRLGDIEGLGRCLRRRARYDWYAGDGDAARTHALAAVDVLEPQGQSVELARAYSSIAQLANLASDIDEARQWATIRSRWRPTSVTTTLGSTRW